MKRSLLNLVAIAAACHFQDEYEALLGAATATTPCFDDALKLMHAQTVVLKIKTSFSCEEEVETTKRRGAVLDRLSMCPRSTEGAWERTGNCNLGKRFLSSSDPSASAQS